MKNLTFYSALLLVIGMPLSPFLLSLSMAMLMVAAVWNTIITARTQGISPAQLGWTRFWERKDFVLLALLFVIPAISYAWSENSSIALERIRVRLPFLLLPIAFANLPILTKRQYQLVLYFFTWLLVGICVGVLFNFIRDYDHIIDDLQYGRPVPVPRNHIRFNLMLVVGILSGGWLWTQRFVWRYHWERTALAIAVVFLFITLHILTVRSGLVALYATLFFTTILYLKNTTNRKTGIVLLAMVVLMPIVAAFTVPSIKQRLSYMLYDWEQYKANAGSNYSDAERWVSLSSGLILWKENPLLGVGVGDLPMEIQRVANQQFPLYSLEPRLPHNQFVYIASTTGIIGLLGSLIAFFAPIFRRNNRRFYLFWAFQVIIFVSFLVEYTLETAIGVAYYLFFLLWFCLMAKEES